MKSLRFIYLAAAASFAATVPLGACSSNAPTVQAPDEKTNTSFGSVTEWASQSTIHANVAYAQHVDTTYVGWQNLRIGNRTVPVTFTFYAATVSDSDYDAFRLGDAEVRVDVSTSDLTFVYRDADNVQHTVGPNELDAWLFNQKHYPTCDTQIAETNHVYGFVNGKPAEITITLHEPLSASGGEARLGGVKIEMAQSSSSTASTSSTCAAYPCGILPPAAGCQWVANPKGGGEVCGSTPAGCVNYFNCPYTTQSWQSQTTTTSLNGSASGSASKGGSASGSASGSVCTTTTYSLVTTSASISLPSAGLCTGQQGYIFISCACLPNAAAQSAACTAYQKQQPVPGPQPPTTTSCSKN